MVELLVVASLLAIVAAVGLPVMSTAIDRNRVWTASELVGAQVRQARLRAISRNTSFRVRFDCPGAGQVRILVVTGDAAIDDAADRCGMTVDLDGGIVGLPQGVTYGVVPTLEVNGRGVFTAGGGLPLTIDVTYGDFVRSLAVSATGQVSFDAF